MKKLHNPLLPKKGGLGVLALFGILFITLIFAFYFWPTNELVAKPTVAQQINTAITLQLAEKKIDTNIAPPKLTGVISLDDPKPKIDPKLVEELKELKRQKKHKSVTILVELKDEQALEAVKKAGGTVLQNFDIGNVAVVEVQSDKVEEISNAAGVEQVASEKEYVAFMADRIPAFSIDIAAWANNITGKGVRIAILDTGVGPHDKITIAEEASFVSDENESDQNGHGTHVAGIAQGIAKDSAIYNAKVLNKAGAGTTSQIIAGINWAVENNVDIISMSFGGMFTELDGPLASAVKDAINHGVVFVVAAGNCKTGCGGFYGVTTPGNVKEVITAGAVDDSNVVASFSSGDTFDGYIKPDVTAPGTSITSTWLNNGEKTLSGTSMSTPFVAGIAALLLEKEPGLTNEQVKQKLESTADDKGTPGKDTSYGSGIVNPSLILSGVPTTFVEDNSTTIGTGNASKITLLPARSQVQVEPIVTNCPENLAYSPELNMTRQEFLTIYEYCLTPKEEINDTPENPNPIGFTDPVEFLDPSSLTKAGVLDEQYKSELKSKALSLQSVNFTALSQAQAIEELQTLAIVEVDYDDIYTYSPSTADDGVAWMDNGDTSKQVMLQGASGFQVICYDWCSTGTFQPDHCFSTAATSTRRQQDFNACSQDSSFVSTVCQAGNCAIGTAEGEHDIATKYIERCTVKARYYQNCGTPSFSFSTIYSAAHYTVKPRQYICESQGGTYRDRGLYDNSPVSWYDFITGVSCTSGRGCDTGEDENNADFGSQGTTTPAAPCSKLDGQSCSSDSQCMTSSYCTSDSYCCPQGQIWTGSQCGTQPACNNNGLCDSGETRTNCPSDCNKGIGDSCTANNQCSTNFCDGNTGTCQAATTCTDGDQDGYGNPGSATCSSGSTLPDCDESSPFVNPGAIEQCNSIDDNCNGQIDEGGVCTPQPTCTDQDGDGYGNPATGCLQSLPDCDDAKSNVHPNAPEICDGFDNDCDGSTDEANVCCGNQQCNTGLGEDPQSCGQDCYTSYQITGIQAPGTANQGQTVQVTAGIQNTGTWPGTINVEGGIIPDGWLPFSNSKCCSNNNFFSNQQTTIQPGQTSSVQFTLIAPGVTTADSCGGQLAWDTSHEITIGLYNSCGTAYQLKTSQDIKILNKPCTKPSDCSLPAEKCAIPQGSTAGTCQASTCSSICTNGQYSCGGETIRHCEDTNNDGCSEWKDAAVCPPGQTCVPGQSTCANVQITTEPFIEEAAGGHVYKQINDGVILNLKYAQQEQISLYYQSTQFELDTTTCLQTFTISKDTACTFKVKTNLEGAQLGVQKQNTIKAARADILTTNNHNGIIITNKKKLKERFAGQEQSVQNLLSEAYGFADDNDLIIYDLQELPVMHPWANFPTYQETIANPFMVDNTLSVEIGKFIRKKCIPPQCQSTLILGDDYVVPHYRRYAQFLNSYFFSSAINTQALYSEIPYVERTSKEFSQLDEVLSEDGYAKPVVIIEPDSVPTEMRTAINLLKSTLQANFSSSPTERNSGSITCNDPQIFNNLNGATVILIGTEQNNRAFNCMPFVAGLENRDSAFLEVNPWDGGEYSIVINTEDSNIIERFSDALHTGAYKKILGRHWYFIELAVDALSFASMACDPFGIPCDYITDAASAKIQCSVKEDAMLCGISKAMLIIPYIPTGPVKLVVKAFIKEVGPAGEKFIVKYGAKAFTFFVHIRGKFDDFAVYFKRAADHFGATTWDDILKKIAHSPEDEEAIALSVKKLENAGKKLKDFHPDLEVLHRAKLLKLGSRYDDLIKANKWVKDTDDLKILYRGDDRYPLGIFYSKAGGFRAKNSAYTDLKVHIIENKPSIFIDTSELRSVASTSAKKNDGWVYEIIPRAENKIDVSKSIPDISDQYKQSRIISYIDEIPTEEIPCAYKLDAAGKVIEILFNEEFGGSVPDGSLCKR